MRKLIMTLLLSIGATALSPLQAADLDIGVVISGEIQPGVYGRVELGTRPPPPLLYAQPVVILEEPRYRHAPVYLHVPPGHAKNWRKHCARYNACGRPVYFVKSAEYEPNYRRDDHHGDHGKGKGKGNGKHKD